MRFSHWAKRFAIDFAGKLLDGAGRLIDLKHVEAPQVFISGEYSSDTIGRHFSKVLAQLKDDRQLRDLIDNFSPSLFDPKIETFIAVTLGVDCPVHVRHIRWAVLSALLTPLRQSVGSCFATAPAILVHQEQPHQFLRDLQDLMATGKLTRTFGGIEYTVPISPSPGLGDLKRPYTPNHPVFESLGIEAPSCKTSTFLRLIEEHLSPLEQEEAKWRFAAFSDHLLLKVWEFTIASFVDVKAEFSKWNLYASLGLHPEETGGIGALIYDYLERRLEKINEELCSLQAEVDTAFDRACATELLMQGTFSERRLRSLKREHQAHLLQLRAAENARNHLAQSARQISECFAQMIERITSCFPQYFQEAYDAQMQEVEATPYDDAPAGFRLMYKHGRCHVGAWSFIDDARGYIDALKSFFTAIEPSLACGSGLDKGEMGLLITAIIHHIESEDFFTSALHRMARAHRVSLEKIPLEKMEKKPWVYTSGGTLPTLIQTYFQKEGALAQQARWVESPQDLCVFLLDTLKALPFSVLAPFLEDSKRRMLAFSPTHAYSLLPGKGLFSEGWQDRGFTYTWVRDRIILPRRHFYDGIHLTLQEQLYLVDELVKRLPSDSADHVRNSFRPHGDLATLSLFCARLPEHLDVESFLFEMLPIITPQRAAAFIKKYKLEVDPPRLLMGRRPFHDLVAHKSHEEIARLLEQEGLAPPPLVHFADSNWETFDFAFAVGPLSGELELWRTDPIGLTGSPMHGWRPLLDGTTRESWGVYVSPHEYVSRAFFRGDGVVGGRAGHLQKTAHPLE